jgi:hypothetical protein
MCKQILHFLQFGWYGLEVGKYKTCLPPKHIGDKIDFNKAL